MSADEWPSLQNLRVVLLGYLLDSDFLLGDELDPNHPGPPFAPDVVQTFESITLPSLKRLSITLSGEIEDDGFYVDQLPFEIFLRRSQCPLTHLEVFHPRIVMPETMIRVLRQLSGTLVSLNMGYSRAPKGPKFKTTYGYI